MRRITLILGVVVVAVVAGRAVQAISAGPGGRLYLSAQLKTGDTFEINLSSIVINPDWTPVGTVNTSHGTILDNEDGNGPGGFGAPKSYMGASPELIQFAGDGYGKIILGAYYNNTPLSSQAAPAQTMDVLRVTPNDGGRTVELLGTGRAYKAADALKRHTDRGLMCFPDPKGQYTGSSASYFVRPQDTASRHLIVTDALSDGDCTDNDADYLNTAVALSIDIYDTEIYGKRMFVNGYGFSAYGTYYLERQAGPTYVLRDWARKTTTSPWNINQYSGIAVGEVADNGVLGGTLHQVVWALDSAVTSLAMFVDWNNDGDAYDTAAVTGYKDERLPIYTAGDVDGIVNDPGTYWNDIELITNEGGTKFLLVVNKSTNGLFVLQLDDNGDFTLGAAGYRLILTQTTGGFTLTGPSSGLSCEMEFDSNLNKIIPEPATLVLAGTGVLGILGYIRRRRMK